MITHVAYKIIVSGVVQGVGFRYFTREAAGRIGVSGTVENQKDGSVIIYAHGDKEKMGLFLEWCHHGPPSATVEKLEYSEVSELVADGFHILR